MATPKKPPANVPGQVQADLLPDTGPPAPSATLDDLDAKIQATGPTDAGAAVRALGSPDAPLPVDAPRKKLGRPPLGTPPSQTHRAIYERTRRAEARAAGAPIGSSPKRNETFAEVASERDALRARVQVQQTQAFSETDLAHSKAAVIGILVILSMGLEFGGIPEGVHSGAEASEIGDAFKEPIAPFLASAGKYADWAVAFAVLAKVEWPHIKAYKERMDREAEARETARLQRGRIGLDIPPSPATMSGGVIP